MLLSAALSNGDLSTVPIVSVCAVSGDRFSLPRRFSSSRGKYPPLPPMNPFGLASNTDVPVPLSCEHSVCTFARLGLLATLPQGASVVFAQGSLFGNPATVTVGPVNNSAVFGA